MNKRTCVIVAVLITFIATSAFFVSTPGMVTSSYIYNLRRDANFFSKKNEIDGLLKRYFIDEYDEDEMQEWALSAYVDAVDDPYTQYIDKEQYRSLMDSISGDYEGIGIEVYLDGDNITIISVFKDSPAMKAGLVSGDIIKAVDGIRAGADNYTEAINRVKGVYDEKGDKTVVLTVLRDGKQKDYELTREPIVAHTVEAEVIEGTNIGYLKISNFAETTYEEFNGSLEGLLNKNVDSLILDLRDNPGGTLDAVVGVADRLLNEGTILTIKAKKGEPEVYKSDKRGLNLPMCVVVNQNSASAAEVLCGALKDHKKATVIGKKTFGKGVVQSVIDFGDETGFKFTSSKYYTPSGECIDGVGISPDIEAELPEELENKSLWMLTKEEDTQLQKAIEHLKKQ